MRALIIIFPPMLIQINLQFVQGGVEFFTQGNIQFGHRHTAAGIGKGLLADAANALHRANMIAVLVARITGMPAFGLAMRLALLPGFFQRRKLLLCARDAFPGGFGLQRLQPFLQRFQVIAQPHRRRAAR